jgi:hypothetical protein
MAPSNSPFFMARLSSYIILATSQPWYEELRILGYHDTLKFVLILVRTCNFTLLDVTSGCGYDEKSEAFYL